MKAYRFDSFASFEDMRLRNEPDPSPPRGEAPARLHAVSFYSDLNGQRAP